MYGDVTGSELRSRSTGNDLPETQPRPAKRRVRKDFVEHRSIYAPNDSIWVENPRHWDLHFSEVWKNTDFSRRLPAGAILTVSPPKPSFHVLPNPKSSGFRMENFLLGPFPYRIYYYIGGVVLQGLVRTVYQQLLDLQTLSGARHHETIGKLEQHRVLL